MSCVAAPATCSAPCYSPVSYASTTEQQCTFTQPSHRQHVAYTSHYSGCFSYLVLDPNMTHCLHQQPLAQTARTPHLHKPELPGSSLSPFFNLLARSYIQANTGFPLFGRCRNSEWFLSFGPTIRHAIASTPESAATAGYLLLVCRSQTPFRLAQSVFPINTYWTCRLE